MRDNRFDGPPITIDITDAVRAHDGGGVTRIPRDKAKAKRAKASRKANRPR